eukprot:COSAG01_NODE_15458_length_1333_cov_0.988682_2_plen_113_part_01
MAAWRAWDLTQCVAIMMPDDAGSLVSSLPGDCIMMHHAGSLVSSLPPCLPASLPPSPPSHSVCTGKGFAGGALATQYSSWQAYCVECDRSGGNSLASASTVHWYRDTRCSSSS